MAWELGCGLRRARSLTAGEATSPLAATSAGKWVYAVARPSYVRWAMPPLCLAGRLRPSENSALRVAAGLGEGPPMPFEVLGRIGAEASLLDAANDLHPARLGTGKVSVEVVHEHPRLVRRRRVLGDVAFELEHHQRAVPHPEFDPGVTVFALGKRIRSFRQGIRRLEPKAPAQRWLPSKAGGDERPDRQ
jgi:hypothetical protein